MTSAEHPFSRSELREELNLTLQHYATKADLADLKAELIKWMAGWTLGGMVVIASLVTVIVNFFGSDVLGQVAEDSAPASPPSA